MGQSMRIHENCVFPFPPLFRCRFHGWPAWPIMSVVSSIRVHLDLPEEVAQQFAAEPGGITRAATEALAIEGVRSGKLTAFQACQMLGIRSRQKMDGFLKAHGIFLPDTVEGIVKDSDTANEFAE